jgi:acetylornithine/succinyldiaminopimelate/putrescine aminotransferase
VLVAPHAASWLHEDGFAHISSGGGAELGCCVAIKVLEITQRPEVVANAREIARFFTAELAKVRALYPDFFVGVRQNGLVMGLEFDHPEGAKHVMRRLYDNGVWAIFSQLDPRVLQWKPGLLKTRELCAEVMEILERSVGQARRDLGTLAA